MSYVRFGSPMRFFRYKEAGEYVLSTFRYKERDEDGNGIFETAEDCIDDQDSAFESTEALLTVVHNMLERYTEDKKWSYKVLRLLAERCGVLEKMT